MDVIKRIDELMQTYGWTAYKLSARSGLSSSTIANIHRRNTIPSIPTLEAICSAFGITLAEFFKDESSTSALSKKQKTLLLHWESMSESQKNLVLKLMKEMKK